MLWENRLSFHNLLSISGGKKVEYLWEIVVEMLWENRLSFHNLLSISGGKKVEYLWENCV